MNIHNDLFIYYMLLIYIIFIFALSRFMQPSGTDQATPEDLRSPFLRAIMRTHTKEIEKLDINRTELEITQRTCQEVVEKKTKLQTELTLFKQIYRNALDTLIQSTNQTFESINNHTVYIGFLK